MGRTRDTSKIFTTVENIDVTEQLDERIFIGSASPTTGNIDGRLWIDTTSASAPAISIYGQNNWRDPIPTVKAFGGIKTQFGIYTIHTFLGSGTFTALEDLSVEYLVVAGGGGGGQGTADGVYGPGGGGAGGMLQGSSLVLTNSYDVTIGAGGVASPSGIPYEQGGNGTNSSISNFIAIGGGGGGSHTGVVATRGGGAGGSGGGSTGRTNDGQTGGAGTAGQGNKGGEPKATDGQGGAGGGGAGGAGVNATSSTIGRDGGVGLSSSITGTSVFYAGGGGGGGFEDAGGSGGNGGGGAGGGTDGVSGTANTGGGGGGGVNGSTNKGGNGGSGIIIIRYLT